MNYLITGGAGFIGSALIRHLISSTNHKVLNIDCLTYAGNLDSLESIKTSPQYSFKNIDICDFDYLVNEILSFKPDIIMHLAAESHVDRSIEEPGAFMKTNIMGTYNLLEAVRIYLESESESALENFRFHHISTDEVYGDLKSVEDFFTSSRNLIF